MKKTSYILKKGIFKFILLIQTVIFFTIATAAESLLDNLIILVILILVFTFNYIISYKTAIFYHIIEK